MALWKIKAEDATESNTDYVVAPDAAEAVVLFLAAFDFKAADVRSVKRVANTVIGQ